jgi:branched-chain amino acid transport system ATP-binding protein
MTSDVVSAGAPALSCDGIRASYGPVQVLFDAGLTVEQGEMVALLGPNGVGKSTLLKVIGGLLRPDDGTVHLGGVDVTGWTTRKRVGSGLCQVVGQATFPSLSVTENLSMHGYASGSRAWTKEAVEAALAVFPRLHARRDQPAANLSGGERQMLALAKAIVVEPKVLVIDEFSLGLAPVVVGGLMELVRRLNDRGSAVLLVEQSVNVALSLVDRVYMMEKGEIIAEESAAALAGDPERVRALMLGGHAAGVST